MTTAVDMRLVSPYNGKIKNKADLPVSRHPTLTVADPADRPALDLNSEAFAAAQIAEVRKAFQFRERPVNGLDAVDQDGRPLGPGRFSIIPVAILLIDERGDWWRVDARELVVSRIERGADSNDWIRERLETNYDAVVIQFPLGTGRVVSEWYSTPTPAAVHQPAPPKPAAAVCPHCGAAKH